MIFLKGSETSFSHIWNILKLPFICPESYNHQHFDGHAFDLWSLGPILFSTLVGGLAPWKSVQDKNFTIFMSGDVNKFLKTFWHDHYSFLTNIEFTRISWMDFWNGEGSPCLTLMEEICCVEPNRRLSFNQLRSHEWISSVDTRAETDCKCDFNIFPIFYISSIPFFFINVVSLPKSKPTNRR